MAKLHLSARLRRTAARSWRAVIEFEKPFRFDRACKCVSLPLSRSHVKTVFVFSEMYLFVCLFPYVCVCTFFQYETAAKIPSKGVALLWEDI